MVLFLSAAIAAAAADDVDAEADGDGVYFYMRSFSSVEDPVRFSFRRGIQEVNGKPTKT